MLGIESLLTEENLLPTDAPAEAPPVVAATPPVENGIESLPPAQEPVKPLAPDSKTEVINNEQPPVQDIPSFEKILAEDFGGKFKSREELKGFIDAAERRIEPANDFISMANEMLRSGRSIEEVYRSVQLLGEDINALGNLEKVKRARMLDNKAGLTEEEISLSLEAEFGRPVSQEDLALMTDEEQRTYKIKQAQLKVAAHAATETLEKHRSTFRLPTREESERIQQEQRDRANAAISAEAGKFGGIRVGEFEYRIDRGSPRDAEMLNRAVEGTKNFTRWLDDTGNISTSRMLRDLFILENLPSILSASRGEAKAQVTKEVLDAHYNSSKPNGDKPHLPQSTDDEDTKNLLSVL